MKTKKLMGGLIAATLITNMAIAGIAFADDATGTLTLNAGSLTLGLDSNSVNLGTLNVDYLEQTQSGVNFPTVYFGDERSDASLGFTLSMTATPLSDGSHTNIAYTGIGVQGDSADTVTAIGASDTTDVDLAPNVTAQYGAFSGSGATSDSLTLVSALAAERVDAYSIDPLLEIVIPAGQPAGTYTSTLTVAIQ